MAGPENDRGESRSAVTQVQGPAGYLEGVVLVVEQDRALQEFLEKTVGRDGGKVVVVSSPAEGIAQAAAMDRLDLFLLETPADLEAFEKTMEAVRFRHPFASLAVLSSNKTPEFFIAALKAGATDFLEKPLRDMGSLLQVIRRGINRSRALRKMALNMPEVRRHKEEVGRLTREMERLKESQEAQLVAFEESQEVFYLDLSRMMTIIDNIVDGIVFTDRDARITLINPVAEHLLGIKSFVAIGKRLSEMKGRPEILQMVTEDQSRVLEEDRVSRTTEIHDEGNDLLYVKLTTTSVTDYRGNFAGVLTVLQDVTAEFKADQLKNQYLSIVSHELRTPLTGIKTFITMMAKGALGPVNEKQGRVLETLREQSLRLEHQIDKLISLGMLEQEDFARDFEVFAVPEVVQAAVGPFDQEAKDRGLQLTVHMQPGAGDVKVKADKQNIKRVLQILLENAIKFNHKGGKVEVSVVTGPGEVLFRVSDTGIGIDPRYHRRIFEKFFQVEDPLTRQHGGAGLGLTVAERILRSHRSSLTLESTLGEGATFQFSLKRYLGGPGEAGDKDGNDGSGGRRPHERSVG